MHDQADPGIGSRAGGEIRIPDLRLQRLAVPPTPTPTPMPTPSPIVLVLVLVQLLLLPLSVR